MTSEDKRRGLGRGLSSLLGDEAEDYASLDKVRALKQVPIEHLQPNRLQPRQRFDKDKAKELAESVRRNGVLEPILVRRIADQLDRYEIVAGERRWRAAQEAALHDVPVVIKELTDATALELALVENIQREDLNPLDEAQGFQRLTTEFEHTQEELAAMIGKSRSHVANTLRLLKLPEAVQDMVADGRLSAGHGRALLNATDAEALAKQIIRDGLNVRQTEALTKSASKSGGKGRAKPAAKDADTLALERDLSTALGLSVTIDHKSADKGGEVRVRYGSLEQLDDICRRLTGTDR